mmetsp:Transcript_45903/g.106725  ORF Transcript_45903/g.106725 Transcript_45903/m.106725 type:complete len:117 (-) Transcript_45903:64-414(-)
MAKAAPRPASRVVGVRRTNFQGDLRNAFGSRCLMSATNSLGEIASDPGCNILRVSHQQAGAERPVATKPASRAVTSIRVGPRLGAARWGFCTVTDPDKGSKFTWPLEDIGLESYSL